MPRHRVDGIYRYRHRPHDRMWGWGLVCLAIGVFVASLLWRDGPLVALAAGAIGCLFPAIRFLWLPFRTFTAQAEGLTVRRTTLSGFFTHVDFYPAPEIRRLRYRVIVHEIHGGSLDTTEDWHHLELHMYDGRRIPILESRGIAIDPRASRRLADHLGVEYVETHEPT